MDITVAGFKGGTGKTTTAIHLAAYFSDRFGSDTTFLADGDPNKSASGWARRGELPFPVVDIMAAARVSRKYDHMIVDSQASPSKEDLEAVASGCDLLILPTSTSALDMDALLQCVEMLQALGTEKFKILLTMVDSRATATTENAIAALTGAGLPLFKRTIRELACFEKAALAGVPVHGVKGDKMSGPAWREYQELGQEIVEAVEHG